MSLPDRPADLSGRPTTPPAQPLPGITRRRFGLFRFRSPLLTESRLLSLPAGNEMFHFPAFPPHALCVQAWVTGHDSCRVSPFGNPRISARLTAPRGLSQPPTSFIGSWCQGIHRAPLLTWPQRCSRPLCSSQGAGGPGLGVLACRSSAAVVRGQTGPSVTGPPHQHRSRAARLEVRVTEEESVQSTGPFPQDPTARLGRLCSLAPFPPASRLYWGCREQRRPTGQCSTLELRPESERLERGSGPSRTASCRPGAP